MISDPDRIRTLIQTYVEDVLCSSKWKQSMQVEVSMHICNAYAQALYTHAYPHTCMHIMQEQKMRAKKRSLLLKVFKTLKAKHEGYLINIPDAISMVAALMGNMR